MIENWLGVFSHILEYGNKIFNTMAKGKPTDDRRKNFMEYFVYFFAGMGVGVAIAVLFAELGVIEISVSLAP